MTGILIVNLGETIVLTDLYILVDLHSFAAGIGQHSLHPEVKVCAPRDSVMHTVPVSECTLLISSISLAAES